MSPIQQAGIAFALIVASGIAGAWLRSKLPEHHLTCDSKDVIKLSVALIATMSALVLALLFASTRTSFERTSGYVSRMTADIAELDKLLGEYGPEARPAGADKGHGDSILYMLRGLAPTDKVQTSIQARALQVSTDLGQTQLALAAQPADSISNTFIFVLVLWLMFIFAVFSMSSPPNPTLFAVIFLCSLSASAAIYLILELAHPFDGLMQISPETLRTALKPLG